MELKVKKTNTVDDIDKTEQEITKYKCVMVGAVDGVKATLTIESEDKDSLERIVPFQRGVKRMLVLNPVDHVLTEVPAGEQKTLEEETEAQT